MATKYIVNNVTGQTINGESVQRPYKVYTALLTQSGVDNPTGQANGLLLIGRTYLIANNAPNQDFTNVGAPNNNEGTYFVATGTIPNSWGDDIGENILTYNTGAPVVTVLENTIGNIWFTYTNIGEYGIVSDSLFTTGKTFITITNNCTVIDSSLYLPNLLINGAGTNSNITINVFAVSTENSAALPNDDFLNVTPIEIRVYN